jgi:pimeloyl-ACP methyl ester carboxylesterase
MRAFRPSGLAADLRYHDLPGHGLTGTGSPLVFVHGLGCAASLDYPEVAADPALAGRRRILVDLLGAGFSDQPEDFAGDVSTHSRVLAEFVAQLNAGPIDLFGHSAGGAIAIETAARLGTGIRRLVLSEPNLDPGGGTFSRRIAGEPEEDYVARGHARTAEAARRAGNGLWAASLRLSSAQSTHRLAASLVSGSVPSWREILISLPMPRTVLFGAASLPDPDVEALPRAGVATAIVPDAGHSMATENPSGLAAAIARALA